MKLHVFVFALTFPPVVAVAEPCLCARDSTPTYVPGSLLVEGVAQSGGFADSDTGFGARASYLSPGAFGTQLSAQTVAGHGTLMAPPTDGGAFAQATDRTTETSFLFTGGFRAGIARPRLRVWASLEAGVGRLRQTLSQHETPRTEGLFVVTPAFSAAYSLTRRLSLVGEARTLFRIDDRSQPAIPALNLGAQLAL